MFNKIRGMLKNKCKFHPLLILCVLIIAFVLNFYMIFTSQTLLFDPLFYFLIILIAYYYPRRGVPASVVIAVLYLAMVMVAPGEPADIVLTSIGHAGFFVIVGFVVSYLITHVPQEFVFYRMITEMIEQSRIKKIIIPSFTAIFTSVIFLLNFIALQAGHSIIFDPLFYFPIILIAYIYPRRGVPASAVIAVLYLVMVMVSPGKSADIVLTSIGHAGFFVIVGFVVSHLNTLFSRYGPIHERFAKIVEFSDNDAYIGGASDGTVTDWNNGAELLFGYKAYEIIGRPLSILLSPGRPDDISHLLEKIQEGAAFDQYEMEPMTKDRRRIHVSLSVSPIKNYQELVIGAIIRMHDITERKLREQVMKETEARQRAMITNISDVIAIIDVNRIMRYKSENIEKLFGWKAEDLVGRHFSQTIHTDDWEQIDRVFKKLLEEENISETVEFRYLMKDGSFHIIKLTAKNLVNDPNINGILVNYHDITERRLAEDTIKRANQKLNVLSQLTRKDLINQVVILNSYLELALDDAVGDGQVIRRIQDGKQAATKITEIVEFTKDYEDMGVKPSVWQNVKLTMLLGLSHMSLGNIQRIIETENLEIFADPLLEKVCQRLFENSVRHGDHVTRIRIRYEVIPGGVVIYFEDDGLGIPQEMKEQIFMRAAGTSSVMRSLLFVRDILEITGITIAERGEPGKGVRFEIFVPDGTWRFAGRVDDDSRQEAGREET